MTSINARHDATTNETLDDSVQPLQSMWKLMCGTATESFEPVHRRQMIESVRTQLRKAAAYRAKEHACEPW